MATRGARSPPRAGIACGGTCPVVPASMGRRRWPVPEVADLPALAELIELPLEQLSWVADERGMQRRTPAGPFHVYRHRWVERPGAAPRLLEGADTSAACGAATCPRADPGMGADTPSGPRLRPRPQRGHQRPDSCGRQPGRLPRPACLLRLRRRHPRRRTVPEHGLPRARWPGRSPVCARTKHRCTCWDRCRPGGADDARAWLRRRCAPGTCRKAHPRPRPGEPRLLHPRPAPRRARDGDRPNLQPLRRRPHLLGAARAPTVSSRASPRSCATRASPYTPRRHGCARPPNAKKSPA